MNIHACEKFAVMLALLVFFRPAPTYAGESLELLKSATESVVAVLKDPRLKAAQPDEFT